MTTLKLRYWLSLLSALLISASAYSQSVQYADTANMLVPYLRKTDTANLVGKYLRKSDTTLMLIPYLRKIDTSFMLSRYLRKTDTSFMLSRYLRKTDTLFMLSPYLRKTDTANLVGKYLRKSDTSQMLNGYLRSGNLPSISGKMNYTDTLNMLLSYLRKGDTSQMLSGYLRSGNLPSISGKMNYTDTLNMLLGYLRKGDTSQMLSGYLRLGNLPSISGKMNYTDTLNMLLGYLRRGDTSQMLSGYLRAGNLPSISGKMNYTDTLNMLLGYLRKGDTSQMLSGYLRSGNLPSISGKMNYADTLAMLQNYLRKTDTASLVAAYLRKSDTATMLKNYVNIAALPAAIAANTVVPSLQDVLNKGNVSSLAATVGSLKTNSPTLLLNNGADTAAALSYVRMQTEDKISGTGLAYNNYFGFHGFIPQFSGAKQLQNSSLVDMGQYGIHYEGDLLMGGVTIGAAGYPLGFNRPTTFFVSTGTETGQGNWGFQVKSSAFNSKDVIIGANAYPGSCCTVSTKISSYNSGTEYISAEFNPNGIFSQFGIQTAGNAIFGGTTLINTTTNNGIDKLQVNGSGRFSGSISANNIIKLGGTNTQYLMADGSVSTLPPSFGSLGTPNYLPKFTANNSIGNSLISQQDAGMWNRRKIHFSNNSEPTEYIFYTPSLANNYGMATGLMIDGEASTGDPSWPLYNHSINFRAYGDLGGGWSSDMNFIIFNGVNPGGYKKVMTIHNYGINVNGEVLSKYVSANYLRVLGTTSGAIEFKAPSAAVANQSYTLPSSTGSNGQVLTTDGTGILNWTTGFTGAGTNGYLPKWTGANALGNSSLFESVGNIGIGVLPSAWQTMTGLQVGEAGSFASKKFSAGNVQTMLGNNVFYDNTGFKYISSEAASMMRMVNNQFQFNIAGTGTASNLITFNQAMTLQSSGNLSLGTIADNGIDKLQVNGSSNISGNVKASSFVRVGGTASQYLMADGSISTLPSYMGGSGTLNYMPKFTSATTIGNSQIFDNGTNVGIGIAGPRAKFELSVGNQTSLGLYSIGAAITSQGGQNNNLYQLAFGYNASNANYGYAAIAGLTSSNAGFNSGGLIFATRSVTTDIAPIERMRITSGGNALIGTTTDNGVNKLQVSGSVAISSNVSIGGQTGAAGVSVIPSMNYSFGEGSGLSYVNLFRQASTAASVLANGYKYSGTAGGFASSISSAWAKSAIAVGFNNGSISFFADPITTVANGTNITPTERMRITSAGNALIGTITDNGLDKLQVNGSGRFISSLSANSFIKVGGTSAQYLMADGSVSTLPSYMVGSGTVNYIPKFTSAAGIGNSQIFDNGTNVGINATAPNYKLTIDGGSNNFLGILSSGIGTPGTLLGTYYGFTGNTYQKGATWFESQDINGRGKFHIALNSAANSSNVTTSDIRMTIDYGGNVGIGTTSPAYPLQLRRAGGAGSLGISIDNVGSTDRTVQYFSVQDNAAGIGSGHAFYYRPPSSTTDVLGMILDEGGKVGIGTTSPATDLQISRSGSSTLRLTNTNNTTNIDFGISTALGFIGTATDNHFGIRTNDIERVRVTNTGNVGIGTTNPANNFVVSNAGAAGLEINPTGGVNSGVLIQAYNRSTAAYMAQSYYALSHTFNVGNGGATRAIDITPSGNVGIGSTNPQANLSIKSGSNVDAEINSLPDGISIQSFNRTSSAYGDISFVTNANGPSLLINNEGQVCIGCTTRKPAAYKLAVEGGIAARSLRITQANPWADYVFDKKYQLKPLDEVEKYIQQNHHLPDMPSAATVAAEGIDVADIQSKLLSKIEELTLYVIELKKEVDALKKNQPKKTKTNK